MRTLLLAVLLPLSASAATYELADLKALEKDQSWRELVDHLTDLVPSKRDAEWKALAERACTGVLDAAEVKDVPSAEAMLAQLEGLLKKFTWLKDSRPFMARRAEVGLKALGWTYQTSRHSTGDDPWLDSLKAFVAADTQTPDIALRGAKLVTSRLVAEVAFPLLRAALARGGKAVCKDADLQQATLGALEDGAWKQEVGEVLTTCWAELGPRLAEQVMKADATRTQRMKLCPALVERKGLGPADQKARCTFD